MKLIKKTTGKVYIGATLSLLLGMSAAFASTSANAYDNQIQKIAPSTTQGQAPVELISGSAIWSFKERFRKYVNLRGETYSEGAKRIAEAGNGIEWQLAPGQTLDPKNPGKIKFTGKVNWRAHGGALDVDLANPTIDFASKKLLIDGRTSGSRKGDPAVNVTQVEIADLIDLTWKTEDGILKVSAQNPVLTEAAKTIVGNYENTPSTPLVATIELAGRDSGSPARQAPIPWLAFPDLYKNPNSTATISEENATALEIPDPRLAACIRETLNIAEGAAITDRNMQQITTFECSGEDQSLKVKSLTGMEYATNLTDITVDENEITDLTPLSKLKWLTSVKVFKNQITSLAPLKDLRNLVSINAEHNQISDLSEFSKSQSFIGELLLNGNKLSNLDNIPAYISWLRAENNQITDISGVIGNKYLKTLSLRFNNIIDPTPITQLPSIQIVDLKDNKITDLTSLEALKNNKTISQVDLHDNPVVDWNPIKGIKAITLPVITHNAVTTGVKGETQNSNDKDGTGDAGLEPHEMFVHIPEGSYYRLSGARRGVLTIENKGAFTISANGVVTFTPLPEFVGEAEATVLTSVGRYDYSATYTAKVTEAPAKKQDPQVIDTPAVETTPVSIKLNDADSPTQAPGDSIKISALGLQPNSQIDIEHGVYTQENPAGENITTVTADSNGSIVYSWTLPETEKPGTHTIKLLSSGIEKGSANFIITNATTDTTGENTPPAADTTNGNTPPAADTTNGNTPPAADTTNGNTPPAADTTGQSGETQTPDNAKPSEPAKPVDTKPETTEAAKTTDTAEKPAPVKPDSSAKPEKSDKQDADKPANLTGNKNLANTGGANNQTAQLIAGCLALLLGGVVAALAVIRKRYKS